MLVMTKNCWGQFLGTYCTLTCACNTIADARRHHLAVTIAATAWFPRVKGHLLMKNKMVSPVLRHFIHLLKCLLLLSLI